MYIRRQRFFTMKSYDSAEFPDTDNIYYDMLIQAPPGSSGPVQARYDVDSRSEILEKVNDWNLSIVRFAIPSNLIPIFNFQIQGGSAQADRDLGVYSVTLVRGATTTQTYLRYDNWNSYVTPLPPPPSLNPPQFTQDRATLYYGVYEIQHMISMINTALDTAFATLPVIPGSAAPRFIYDPVTKLISLIALSADYDVNTPGYTEIYVNSDLFRFLQSIPTRRYGYNTLNGKDYQFLMADYSNNHYSVTEWSLSQAYPCLSDWNDITSIIFRSSSIPSRTEYSPNGLGEGADLTDNPTLAILNDFIQYPVDNGNLRGTLLYTPTAEYRWIDLVGTGELKAIKINVFWSDRQKYIHPIYLNTYDQLSAKILFQRRKPGQVLRKGK